MRRSTAVNQAPRFQPVKVIPTQRSLQRMLCDCFPKTVTVVGITTVGPQHYAIRVGLRAWTFFGLWFLRNSLRRQIREALEEHRPVTAKFDLHVG